MHWSFCTFLVWFLACSLLLTTLWTCTCHFVMSAVPPIRWLMEQDCDGGGVGGVGDGSGGVGDGSGNGFNK